MRRIKNKKKHKKEERHKKEEKSRHPCSSLPSSIVTLDTCSVTEKEPSNPLSFYSFEDGSYGPEPPVTEPSNLEASASSS